MCDYCDCRTRPLLAQLGVDHERINLLAGQLLRQLEDGDRDAARKSAAQLAEVLRSHSELEERSLYIELADEGVSTARLFEDHRTVDATFGAAAAGSEDVWSEVPGAVRRLGEHIDREEYDLFPAAHQLLGDAAWDRVERRRAETHGPAPLGDHRP